MALDARKTYLRNTVNCAPPERLLTMLYDALVNNVVMAEEALERKDYYVLNERLVRAQEIVLVLQGTLKPELWRAGPVLVAIYNYVYRLLVRGNVHKDAGALSEARKLLEPLQAANHAAADKVLAERAAAKGAELKLAANA
ncbi:MAG TPA: flagellar export chaperone FliS [Acidimicrobiales bacterium]|nr:flagellar export chaperone FliS [Acidimicrobiales bacterium]